MPRLLMRPGAIAMIAASLSFMVAPWPAFADAGHDHGPAAASAAPAAALPRFTASSESFELVGIVDGKRLTLYLDHAPDNRPVEDVRLAIDVAGQKIDVAAHGKGEFEATLAALLQPGVTPVTATVMTASDSDLLAGEIDLHVDAHADAAAPRWSASRIAGWVLGGVLAMALIAWLARRAVASRRAPVGGVA